MQNLTVNIYTNELTWVGALDKVESLTLRTTWNGYNHSEMSVPKDVTQIEELQIGRVLVFNNQLDKAVIIEDLTTSLEEEYITYTLLPLKGILNYRICNHLDVRVFTQKRQSEVMKLIVWHNLISQPSNSNRPFWNKDRTKNLLGVAELKPFGDTIDYSIDWNTGLMGDTLTAIANMYGKEAKYPLGWNIYIKPDYSGYELEVYHGTHRHINQTTNPPVIFSDEYGNIKNATYSYSIKEWRNIAYMIYDNGGKAKTVGLSTKGNGVGFERKEIVLHSSKTLESEAMDEGYSELNKRPHIENFTAEIINNPNTMTSYRIDWNLGDIVTVQSKTILKNKVVSVDAMITEIEEVYDSGEYSVNVTFGEARLSLIDLIKNEIK